MLSFWIRTHTLSSFHALPDILTWITASLSSELCIVFTQLLRRFPMTDRWRPIVHSVQWFNDEGFWFIFSQSLSTGGPLKFIFIQSHYNSTIDHHRSLVRKGLIDSECVVMADLCLSCVRTAASEDPVYIYDSFCKRWVHSSCLAVTEVVVKDLTKEGSQFLCLCSQCSAHRRDCSSVAIMDMTTARDDLKAQLISEIASRLEAASESMKRALISPFDQVKDVRTNTHSSWVNLRTSHTPSSTNTPIAELTNPAKRRLVDRSPPSNATSSPLLSGTLPIATPSQAALFLPPETSKFWLHLSRCRSSATVSDVLTPVKEQIGVAMLERSLQIWNSFFPLPLTTL